MDLSVGFLFSSLLISLVGLAVFLYGKKMENYVCLGIGLGLMVYPIFVPSVLVMWVIAAAGGAALYFFGR